MAEWHNRIQKLAEQTRLGIPVTISTDPRHAFSQNPLASDETVLDVIFGQFNPQGKLPFELPSSMQAVRKQKEDVPHDSEDPLFEFGHGLSY